MTDPGLEEWLRWHRETERRAKEPFEETLAAGKKGDAARCAEAARRASLIYLERYLDAVEVEEGRELDRVSALLAVAEEHDPHFARLRGEAALLDAAGEGRVEAGCEELVEATKEVRMLAGARAGRALGFRVQASDAHPRLQGFVVHSTTEARAKGIFEQRALYSFNRCAEKGLLSGEPVGVRHLLDPRRMMDFVIFGVAEHKYYAGEKVANSQRKGWVDEALAEDYRPSVRLFFRREELEGLAGYEDDGVHVLLVRDEVTLDLLAYAVFPSEAALDASLEAVEEDGQREWLRERCLVAPAECCGKPMAYVKGTNELVARRAVGERQAADRVVGER
jgi:hypothetical protein